ncbi:MAG: Holliday junction branch migration protein RuvA [Candidatus Atribacteria bacterium]|nr:Holliday junction branch migration protein RuvA [Candidatus Atribacteria bacterium]
MISFLKGRVESKESGSIVINVNGVGYLVQVPFSDKFDLNQSPQTIYTYLYVREDRIALYGFLNQSERDFFKILIDTPGIGPKVALNIISDMGPERFQYAVLEENIALISTISGIGPKLAKKIILELKEKFRQFKPDLNIVAVPEEKKDFVEEGIEALKALGYSDREAKQKILKALGKLKNQKSITIEELIKESLNKV